MQWMGGPQYCETPARFVPGDFPVEPFNTYSNLSIILFALVGFYLVVRRVPRAWDFYLLCTILLVNGLGSFFWHGLRDRTALLIDVQAGLLFLIGLFFLWARRVMPLWQSLVFVVAFYLTTSYFDAIDLIPYGRWASMMPAIMLFGAYLIYRTSRYSAFGAYVGSVGIVSALLALTFRTVDTEHLVCGAVPMGTHFLWHIFLSAAAFTGILAMMAVVRKRETQAASSASVAGAPAE